MKSKTTRHGLKRMTALLLAVVLCVGMVPTAFAAQQDSYHDPAENWQEGNKLPFSSSAPRNIPRMARRP